MYTLFPCVAGLLVVDTSIECGIPGGDQQFLVSVRYLDPTGLGSYQEYRNRGLIQDTKRHAPHYQLFQSGITMGPYDNQLHAFFLSIIRDFMSRTVRLQGFRFYLDAFGIKLGFDFGKILPCRGKERFPHCVDIEILPVQLGPAGIHLHDIEQSDLPRETLFDQAPDMTKNAFR